MTEERLGEIEKWLDGGHVQLGHAAELFAEVERLREVNAQLVAACERYVDRCRVRELGEPTGPHPSDVFLAIKEALSAAKEIENET